jgi:hypothetical protein
MRLVRLVDLSPPPQPPLALVAIRLAWRSAAPVAEVGRAGLAAAAVAFIGADELGFLSSFGGVALVGCALCLMLLLVELDVFDEAVFGACALAWSILRCPSFITGQGLVTD